MWVLAVIAILAVSACALGDDFLSGILSIVFGAV